MNPEATLIDLQEIPQRPRPGRMLIQPGEEVKIFQGLYERGLVAP